MSERATWRWDTDDDDCGEPVEITVPTWFRVHDVAEDAAEQFHANHDGWEAAWPVVFRLYPPGSDTFVRVKVERDYEPTFSAYGCDEPEEER